MAPGVLPVPFHRQPMAWSLHLWSFIILPYTVGWNRWESSSGAYSALHYVLGHYILGRRIFCPTLRMNKNTHTILERSQWGGAGWYAYVQNKHKRTTLPPQCTWAPSTWAPIGRLWRISIYVQGQDFLWRGRLGCKHQSLPCSTGITSVFLGSSIYLWGSDGIDWVSLFSPELSLLKQTLKSKPEALFCVREF